MSHANAPLSIEGRRRLVERCKTSPYATPAWVVGKIESWRREHKWSAQRIADELSDLGFMINRRTVTRQLSRLGLDKRRFIDP
jgi:DNA-directed RNA polymerase specialized sigma54-like protein